MSTYSNEPQQNQWELYFITSIVLLFIIIIWGINDTGPPIIYDGLLLLTIVNLWYCIYVGMKK